MEGPPFKYYQFPSLRASYLDLFSVSLAFKLRDLAYVLNGTGSQFSVEYDAAASAVSIAKLMAYTPNNTELVTGADNSGTAVLSGQPIFINGVQRGFGLTVYNIGGSNFFQLRELGTL